MRVVIAIALAVALTTGASQAAAAETARVSLSAPAQVTAAGDLVARGKVAPVPRRGWIRVQARHNGAWRTLGGTALHHGRFKLRLRAPAAAQILPIRALLFEDGHQVSRSEVRNVRVHRIQPGKQAPSRGTTSPAPPVPNPGPSLAAEPLSAASLMATIERYASLPNHLSGTANSAAALDQFSTALGAAGLRLGQQAFTYPEFGLTKVALSAGGDDVPDPAVAPLLYSGTTGSGGVTAQLFDGGDGSFDASEVAGKIVVVSVTYQNNSKAAKLDPAIESAVEGGAAALVAVTQGVRDYPKWEDVNARKGTGPLPVLLVGKRSGAAVITAAEAGKTGTVTLAATTSGLACDRDVWGELEGADPSRRVFVATPASSFTPSASEHGSAFAIVLGLARHYAALPVSERPETLVFMALGGHEVGWLGLQALMNSSYASWFEGADAYVHLGSALGADTAKEEPDGTIVTTPVPDPTGLLHNSENPLLGTSILEDFAAAGVPTKNRPPHEASGGEQTYAYAAGIPTISFSGASLWFHTAGDLPSVVDPTILSEDAEAFRRSIDTITAIPAGQLKAENTEAETYAEALNPDQRAPVNPTLGAAGVGGPAATPVAECP